MCDSVTNVGYTNSVRINLRQQEINDEKEWSTDTFPVTTFTVR
jgi:hypothetical protein